MRSVIRMQENHNTTKKDHTHDFFRTEDIIMVMKPHFVSSELLYLDLDPQSKRWINAQSVDADQVSVPEILLCRTDRRTKLRCKILVPEEEFRATHLV